MSIANIIGYIIIVSIFIGIFYFSAITTSIKTALICFAISTIIIGSVYVAEILIGL